MAKSQMTQTPDEPKPPDWQERQRILKELDRNLLVEAAAGTGKTTSMIGRMAALLEQGKCTVDGLAAVTFTRKAAAELRTRFQIELERRARAATGSSRTHLDAAIQQIERCFIGTIHSFCGRLLRERPVEAGVDVAFRELDDEEDQLLRRQAWADYVAALHVHDDPILAELAELGLDVAQLQDAFSEFAEYPDVAHWPAEKIELPDLQPTLAAVQEYAQHMQAVAATFTNDAGKDKLMPKYEAIPRVLRLRDLNSAAEIMAILEEFTPAEITIVQKNWPGTKKQALEEKETWSRFVDTVAQPLLAQWRAKRYEAILRTLRPARDHCDHLRREAGALNFSDLLMHAAGLLRDKSAVRKALRQRFTHLLVDEFQDTDPIQAEVMLLLTADDPGETDWRACRPAPGALFVVGDPKQSIYRFRRADITTYNEFKQILVAAGGAVVELWTNFRSTAPVIDWINRTFENVFPATASPYQPARRPMETMRASGPSALPSIQHALLPAHPALLEFEAGVLARTIQRAINDGCEVPRSEKELQQGTATRAAPGDFLIVGWRKHHLHAFGRKLQELGLPHQVSGGRGLNDVPEIAFLHACLRAVTRPDDALALVAVLRGELFGFSDTSLYAFRKAGGQFSFSSDVPSTLTEADGAAFRDAFERLRRYRRCLQRLPAGSAAEQIAAELGLSASAAAGAGGNGRAGMLAKLIEWLRTMQAESHSPSALVDALGQFLQDNEPFDGVPARPHDGNVVRVMNLHQVKGLEAPFVFLADPSGKSKHEPKLHIDRSQPGGHGFLAIHERREGSFHAKLLACPLGWREKAEEESLYLKAEEERLLYVAATRAGFQLTIVQRETYQYLNPWQFFAEHLQDQATMPDPGASRPGPQASVTIHDQLPAEAAAAAANRWLCARQPSDVKKGVKEFAVTGGPIAGAGRAHGTEWGTLIHGLLETAMLSPNADLPARAAEQLALLELEGEDKSAWIEEAVDTVRKVMASAIWRRAQASERRLVELPFHTPYTAESGESLLLTGVIDLMFRERTGWVIVDYKTDTRPEGRVNELVDHYRPQVQTYKDIFERLTGEKVCETGLYFTHLDRYEKLQ